MTLHIAGENNREEESSEGYQAQELQNEGQDMNWISVSVHVVEGYHMETGSGAWL